LFWDVDARSFDPRKHADYTIARVLEYGDRAEVVWLKETFSEDEIRRVLCTESRLSPKSATFWALVYGIPYDQVAALTEPRTRLDR
jgi:hypothetical protein